MTHTLFFSVGGLLVAGGIAWGVLRQKVCANSRSIESLWRHKQDVQTCSAQHRAIMRELDTINKKLDKLK